MEMRVALSMICCVAPLAACALTDAQLDSLERVFDLNEVVVTGTRTPKALKDTPVATRLITESEIRRTDASNLQDLLQQELPGVEFSYAMNQQVNMNLAGFAGQGVLILVDGERLAGETMDNVDFSRLSMSNVARIEITRGASSALYGSNAAGGVINIITKEADQPWTATLHLRGGSHNEWRAGGSVGTRVGKVSNHLDVAFNRIDSYDVCLDAADECDFRRVYGFKVWNISDKLTYRPLHNLKLSGRAGYYFKQRLYNPDIPDRYRDFTGGVRGEWSVTDADYVELSYAYDQYDKSDFNRAYGLDIRDYSNVQHSVKALYNRTMRTSDVLTVGADMLRDWLNTYQFDNGVTHSQYSADAFVQYDWNVNRDLELVGAVRWDWFSDGRLSCITPKLSARYRLGRVTVRGGYAGGFRAPTLKEKYMNFNMADIFDIHGNADLKPERSHNFNLSAEYSWRNYYFSAGGNFNVVNNRIATSAIRYDRDNNPYIDYINIRDLKVYGFDATVRARWVNGMAASLSYNFTREETRGGSVSQYCPARPHSLNGRVSWTHEWRKGCDTDVSLTGKFLSRVSYESMEMYEPFESRSITNPAYTLWRLQLSQRVVNGLQLVATIDNLLNYRPAVYSFNAPVTAGTTFSVGLNIDIERFFK